LGFSKGAIMRIRACPIRIAVAIATFAGCGVPHALAADNLKLAVTQCGSWGSSQIELGTRAGFYAKHGIELEVRCTQGGADTRQAVVSGRAEIGIGIGTFDALAAFAKGEPIRIIAASETGSADFWIVNADSPLRTIKDATSANTIAYSANGATTQYALLGFNRELGLKAKPIATGGPVKTISLLLAQRIDIAWTTPPLAFDLLDTGQVRIFARANDVPTLREQTIRVTVASTDSLRARRAVLARFAQAMRETTDWMYSDAKALEMYADYRRISVHDAKRLRDEFFPRSALDPDSVKGLDALMTDAVKYKFIDKPLTPVELADFVQVPLK
jgi:NitT/TauT family transport system substrate-binding protein